VADVCVHARQFFGNVAAIDEHGDFLEQPLAIELVACSGDQPLREPLLVALFDIGAKQRDSVHGPGKTVERRVEDGFKGFAFAGPHRLELMKQRDDFALDAFGQRRRVFVAGSAVVGLQRTGQAEDGI